MARNFNILAVLQGGRLAYEALVFLESLRAVNATLPVYFAEPLPGPSWETDPRLEDGPLRARLEGLGAKIIGFENHIFGSRYPHGNKILAPLVLPANEPFVFFDTDTLFLSDPAQVPFPFHMPSASLQRQGTWPKLGPDTPDLKTIWASLYEKFGLNFTASLDLSCDEDDWQRYLYFNAGWFYGENPHQFADHFSHFAAEIERNPPKELQGQALYPWLDQIALPLVVSALGGRRRTLPDNTLDGAVSCHWRTLPLLYARESDDTIARFEEICAPNPVKKLLKEYEPFKRIVYQGKGAKIRALFEDGLPDTEQAIRKRIKDAGMWMR